VKREPVPELPHHAHSQDSKASSRMTEHILNHQIDVASKLNDKKTLNPKNIDFATVSIPYRSICR
jgi:hypothetical protein